MMTGSREDGRGIFHHRVNRVPQNYRSNDLTVFVSCERGDH
jgi:hypothetical protein